MKVSIDLRFGEGNNERVSGRICVRWEFVHGLGGEVKRQEEEQDRNRGGKKNCKATNLPMVCNNRPCDSASLREILNTRMAFLTGPQSEQDGKQQYLPTVERHSQIRLSKLKRERI